MRHEVVRRISGRKGGIERYQDGWKILCIPD